jgi:hypothetical protein
MGHGADPVCASASVPVVSGVGSCELTGGSGTRRARAAARAESTTFTDIETSGSHEVRYCTRGGEEARNRETTRKAESHGGSICDSRSVAVESHVESEGHRMRNCHTNEEPTACGSAIVRAEREQPRTQCGACTQDDTYRLSGNIRAGPAIRERVEVLRSRSTTVTSRC